MQIMLRKVTILTNYSGKEQNEAEEQCVQYFKIIIFKIILDFVPYYQAVLISHNQNQNRMLRLISNKALFFISNSKYMIKNGEYLIETPTSFASPTEAMKKVADLWKASPDEQKTFNELASKENQIYNQKLKEYEQKYEIPFKRWTFQTMAIQRIYDSKRVIHIKGEPSTQRLKRAQELVKTLPSAEVKQIKEEVQKINEERNILKEKYKFPQKQHKTLQTFTNRHFIPKANRTPTYKEQMQRSFKAYEDQWKSRIDNWLKSNGYQISLEQFIALYNERISKKPKPAEKILTQQQVNKNIVSNADQAKKPQETIKADPLKTAGNLDPSILAQQDKPVEKI